MLLGKIRQCATQPDTYLQDLDYEGQAAKILDSNGQAIQAEKSNWRPYYTALAATRVIIGERQAPLQSNLVHQMAKRCMT